MVQESRVAPLRRAAIIVANLDRSLTLYRDVLGLSVWKQGEAAEHAVFFQLLGVEARRARFAILQSEGSEIGMVGLFEVREPSPPALQRDPDGGVMRGEVALVFPARDVTALHEAVSDLELTVVCPPTRFDVPGGGEAFEMTFRDFDGALVNLIQRL